MTAEDDAVDRALESVQSLDWDNEPHRDVLAHEIEHRARRNAQPSRPRLAVLAVAVVLLAGGIALASDPLRRWISVWIDSIERDPAGEVESMTLRTEDGLSVQLVPLDESPGAFNPAIDDNAPELSVPMRDGGTARIRILRRGRKWHETFYSAIDASTRPAAGDRFTVQAVRLAAMTVAPREGVLEVRHTFEDGQVIDFVLRALPQDPRRFGDGETLVELIAP